MHMQSKGPNSKGCLSPQDEGGASSPPQGRGWHYDRFQASLRWHRKSESFSRSFASFWHVLRGLGEFSRRFSSFLGVFRGFSKVSEREKNTFQACFSEEARAHSAQSLTSKEPRRYNGRSLHFQLDIATATGPLPLLPPSLPFLSPSLPPSLPSFFHSR